MRLSLSLLAIVNVLLGCAREPGQGQEQAQAAMAVQAAGPVQTAGLGPQPQTLEAAPAPQPLPALEDAPTAFNEGFGQHDVPPDFKLNLLANGSGPLSLSSLVGAGSPGRVDGVVVAFVASWCGRCKDSYPTLEALQKQHGERLRILLLTAESDQNGKDKMAEILSEKGITLPLLDAPPEMVDLWLGSKKNIPRFYLIDHSGTIRVKDTGFGDKMKKLLPQQIDWLLARRYEESEKKGL